MPGPTARGPEAVDAAEGVTATTWTRRLLDRLAPVFPLARQVADPVAARLLVAGVAVGAIGGLAAGVFDRAMVLVGRLTLGTAEPALNEPVWWRALLAPTLLGAVAGLLLVRLTRRGRAQSVPDVLGRTQLHVDTLSLRDGVVSAVAAALVVGGGVSGGREGPIAQVSSALASWICRRLRLPPRHARALLAAGAAAGVAASFNTPVGGAFFGLEIVLGDFALESFAPVVVATVTGTIVGQALLGDRVALHLPPFRLVPPPSSCCTWCWGWCRGSSRSASSGCSSRGRTAPTASCCRSPRAARSPACSSARWRRRAPTR
jgi:H+/Cl- antiporter ClcA